MGFLLGAFGKLSAGRRKREIQARMMRVQSRLRRATKQVGEMDKMLQRQEKLYLNQFKTQAALAKQQAYTQVVPQELQNYQELAKNGSLTTEQSNAYNALMSEFNQSKLGIDTQYQNYIAQAEQKIADYFEYLRETQLEPLKAEEEMLQTEQEQLKSQLELAEADYKACGDMEKSGAKDLAPQYTAGGN